jgi:hypothetical protein
MPSHILRNDNIAPRDCRINFVVPSNPILTKESSKYTLDAENPGLPRIPLYSFAANNAEKDVKRSWNRNFPRPLEAGRQYYQS